MQIFTKGERVYIPDPLAPKYFRTEKFDTHLNLANERHLVFKHELTARMVGKSMAKVLQIKED